MNIDQTLPTSAVAPLPTMAADTTFTVRWSGSDDADGSGLLDYTIYVSDNGGAYAAWLTNTTLTEADYIGESGHSYAFYSVARDNTGNVEAAPAVPDAVTTAPDTISPTVTRVLVASSAWSSDFLNSLGGVGYAIPDGPNQLRPLPGGNLNEVIIEFSENVIVAEGDLALTGVNVPSYGFSAFSYDPLAHRATWTISRNLPRDQLLVDLDGSTANAVTDMAGNRLDGDFQFRINVLPGDVNQDGTVDAKDLEVLATNYRQSVLGWANGDFNCDGVVNVLDLAVLAANYRHTLGGLSLSGPALDMAAILGSGTPTPPANQTTEEPPANLDGRRIFCHLGVHRRRCHRSTTRRQSDHRRDCRVGRANRASQPDGRRIFCRLGVHRRRCHRSTTRRQSDQHRDGRVGHANRASQPDGRRIFCRLGVHRHRCRRSATRRQSDQHRDCRVGHADRASQPDGRRIFCRLGVHRHRCHRSATRRQSDQHRDCRVGHANRASQPDGRRIFCRLGVHRHRCRRSATRRQSDQRRDCRVGPPTVPASPDGRRIFCRLGVHCHRCRRSATRRQSDQHRDGRVGHADPARQPADR